MSNGLKNYWSMDNHVNDTVGGANLYNGYNVKFVNDRFGNPNSAIKFSDGYYQVPPGVYFRGDFTVSVWLKLNAYVIDSRIIDFGNGADVESVLFSTINQNNVPYFYTSFSSSGSVSYSSLALIRGQWLHLAATLSGTTGSVYINGILAGQTSGLFIPRNINRTSNYVGKNNWEGYGNIWAELDDLRIYDRALCQSELYDLIYLTSSLNTANSNSSTNKPIKSNQTTNFKY